MAAKALCSIPDCGKPRKSNGYCNPHYMRHRRHGDPLAGRINGGAAQEELRLCLLTENKVDCWIWPYAKDEGRAIMGYDGRRQFVARVVCQIAHGHPPSPKYEAAHSCGNGHLGCVSRHHLRWATHAENMNDGIASKASGKPRKRITWLTPDDVRSIRAQRARGVSINALSSDFDVNRSTIRDILTGRSWNWLAD